MEKPPRTRVGGKPRRCFLKDEKKTWIKSGREKWVAKAAEVALFWALFLSGMMPPGLGFLPYLSAAPAAPCFDQKGGE